MVLLPEWACTTRIIIASTETGYLRAAESRVSPQNRALLSLMHANWRPQVGRHLKQATITVISSTCSGLPDHSSAIVISALVTRFVVTRQAHQICSSCK